MPLHWTIDAEDLLVTTVADGDITRREVETYIEAVDGAGALTYRKLVDVLQGTTSMGAEDMLALGVRVRSFHVRGLMGSLAIIIPRGQTARISRLLGMLATADRPMRLFHEVEPARRWIVMQDVPPVP